MSFLGFQNLNHIFGRLSGSIPLKLPEKLSPTQKNLFQISEGAHFYIRLYLII